MRAIRALTRFGPTYRTEKRPSLIGWRPHFHGTSDAISATRNTVDAASDQIIQAGKDIHAILADPALKSILSETNGIASHADSIAANLEESSKQMPLIAADIERIAATSSRYRKAILLSQILSAVARAFF